MRPLHLYNCKQGLKQPYLMDSMPMLKSVGAVPSVLNRQSRQYMRPPLMHQGPQGKENGGVVSMLL